MKATLCEPGDILVVATVTALASLPGPARFAQCGSGAL
jgi:hypothetical protein